jgi:hypothetical protein
MPIFAGCSRAVNPADYRGTDQGFAAHRLGGGADETQPGLGHRAHIVDAIASYPAIWTEPEAGEKTVTGTLTVSREGVLLDGGTRRLPVRRSIPLGDVASVHVGRSRAERLDGRPAIVVERRDAPVLLLRPLGLGLLTELAERLAQLCANRTRVEQVAVVLSLAPAALDTARALVAEGPPFDLDEAGIEEHEVFLTKREAVFVFSGENACESARRFAHDATVWRAADRWAACLDSPPRLASPAGET